VTPIVVILSTGLIKLVCDDPLFGVCEISDS